MGTRPFGSGTDTITRGTSMSIRRFVACAVLFFVLPALSGCWYAAAAGAGAYGGYKAKESGYSLQNPVTKDGSKKTEKKESE